MTLSAFLFFLCVSVLVCLLLLLVLFPWALLCLLFLEFCFMVVCSVEHCLVPLCHCDCLVLGHSGVSVFHFPDVLHLSALFVGVSIHSSVVLICLPLRLYSCPFSVWSLYDLATTGCSTLALTHFCPISTLTVLTWFNCFWFSCTPVLVVCLFDLAFDELLRNLAACLWVEQCFGCWHHSSSSATKQAQTGRCFHGFRWYVPEF